MTFFGQHKEWEKCVQTIQNLPPRKALVKAQGRRLRLIRTIQVQDRGCSEEQLERLKAYLARKAGVRYELARPLLETEYAGGKANEEPAFWEPLPSNISAI